MSLHLIVGPMFSGKSGEIMGIIRKYKSAGYPYLVITHKFDTAYNFSKNKNKSGSKSKNKTLKSNKSGLRGNSIPFPSIAVENFSSIRKLEDFAKARLVIIKETQFFRNLKDFVLDCVETFGKNVVCVGLDGDSDRNKFGEILDLIPYCDSIEKRNSICARGPDPHPAPFTRRKGHNKNTLLPGGKEVYEALCRKHYLQEVALDKKDKRPLKKEEDKEVKRS
jgi:thymidine kinase